MEYEKQSEMRRAIRPYWIRIRRQRQLDMAGKGMLMGTATGILLCVLAFLVPIPWSLLWASLAIMAGSAIGYVLPLFLPWSMTKRMQCIDAYGFEERMQTMWEWRDGTDAFARLQREDAMKHLQEKKARDQISFSFERKNWIGLACGLAVIGLLSIVPNPQRAALAEKANAKTIMQEQAMRIENEMKGIAENKKIDAEIKKQLNEELKKLAETLRKENALPEGMKQISNTQKKIVELDRQQREREAERVKNELEKKTATQALGEHLQDAQNKQALDQWEKELEEARKDAKKTQEIAEALKETAASLSDGALRDALEEAAAAVESGSFSDMDQLSANIQQALQNLGESDQDASTSNSIGQISDMLKMAKSQMGKSGNANQNQANLASSSGNGQASQNGQSPNQGTGGNGSSGGNGKGNGAGGGSGELKAYKKIYDATRVGGEGDIVQIEGQKNEQGESLQGEVEGIGRMEGYIPDQKTIGRYQEQAVQAAQREDLPPAMQEWVSGYFESLQNE